MSQAFCPTVSWVEKLQRSAQHGQLGSLVLMSKEKVKGEKYEFTEKLHVLNKEFFQSRLRVGYPTVSCFPDSRGPSGHRHQDPGSPAGRPAALTLPCARPLQLEGRVKSVFQALVRSAFKMLI